MNSYDQLLPDYYGDFVRARANGEARRKTNALADLDARYYSGEVSPEQQPAFLGEVAQNGGPEAAAYFRKDALAQAGQLASMFETMDEPTRQQAYPRLAQAMHAAGIPVPGNYDPTKLPLIAKFAESAGFGGGDDFKPMNVSPGGAIVDPRTGRPIYEREFAPPKDVWDSSRGAWITAPGAQSPPAPMPPHNQPQPTGRRVQFDFSPGTPPGVIAATEAWAGADSNEGSPMPDAPQPQGARAIVPEGLPPRQPNPGITVNTGDQVKPFQKAMGELQAKNLGTWQEDSIVAQDALAKIDALRKITALQRTGKVEEAKALVGQYFGTQAGSDLQAFNATVGPMVIDLATKLKPLSNSDITFVRTAMPRFGNDPRANAQIIDLLEGAANRQVRLYEDAAHYAEEHGSLDGFRPPAPSRAPAGPSQASGPTATDPKTGRQVQWNGRAWVTIKPGER